MFSQQFLFLLSIYFLFLSLVVNMVGFDVIYTSLSTCYMLFFSCIKLFVSGLINLFISSQLFFFFFFIFKMICLVVSSNLYIIISYCLGF
jgi:hypothetical protein